MMLKIIIISRIMETYEHTVDDSIYIKFKQGKIILTECRSGDRGCKKSLTKKVQKGTF